YSSRCRLREPLLECRPLLRCPRHRLGTLREPTTHAELPISQDVHFEAPGVAPVLDDLASVVILRAADGTVIRRRAAQAHRGPQGMGESGSEAHHRCATAGSGASGVIHPPGWRMG